MTTLVANLHSNRTNGTTRNLKNSQLDILFENDDFFIVNKPAHISTLDERTQDGKPGMIRLAKAYSDDAQACHRLDKETSGALLFAKHPAAYRHAAMAFEARDVTKIYHAVVCGVQDLQGVRINLPILPLKTGVVRIDKLEGKDAVTLVQTKDVYRAHTLVECFPVTGRMHQIRVHLAYMDAPIVADELYGGKNVYLSEIKRKFNLKQETEELPLINRVALHAYSLTLEGLNGEEISVVAPYPKDIRALITQLEKNK